MGGEEREARETGVHACPPRPPAAADRSARMEPGRRRMEPDLAGPPPVVAACGRQAPPLPAGGGKGRGGGGQDAG